MENYESKIRRLKELDEKLWAGVISKEEDRERKLLRVEIQKSSCCDDACPPANRGGGYPYRGEANGEKPGPITRHRLSFKEAITKAEEQIGFYEYSRQHACYGILHDMCRAMAEVYMMPPRARIKVNGEELEAEMVAEVLENITQEMAETRAEELRETIAGVTNIKAYLRSALYNKVFEFETAEVKIEEQVKKDMGRR